MNHERLKFLQVFSKKLSNIRGEVRGKYREIHPVKRNRVLQFHVSNATFISYLITVISFVTIKLITFYIFIYYDRHYKRNIQYYTSF